MRRAPILALMLAVAGCGLFDDSAPPLPGERIPIRQAAPERLAPPDVAQQVAALGPPTRNADWAQRNAVPTRAPGHLTGPAGFSEAWRVDAGGGASGAARITSGPVVSGGRVFTLDAASTVSAFDAASGARLWRQSLTPEGESARSGFGGGLAVAEGRVIASTGFGEALALSVSDGSILWRRRLGAPSRAAPAVEGGLAVVVTRDDTAFGLDVASGDVRWRAVGTVGGAGVLGGASPAMGGGLAILPFASGELVAVSAANGRRVWADALGGGRRSLARAAIADVSGDPVIAGFGVFASSHSGVLVAIDARSGRRGWAREIGTTSPVWPVGATLFLIDDTGRLMRLAAGTGETLWVTELPAYRDPARRRGVITYAGPVVASDRVWVTSSAGELLAFNPATGEPLGSAPIPGGSITGPVVANGVLYVLSDRGTLHAFR
ncbi:MAG: hypothetical protein EA355_07640 [Rhodobacteraceae bacterium]|nr:MAG: hypothetical protein EA355_07640 [Paracoccaceae bacterium]